MEAIRPMVLKICPKRFFTRGRIPKHNVKISSFWMDTHEATNADFQEFVDATGYITTAEQAVIGRNSKTITT
jgi:formylglycine-generating enzyme required for sulfatase activity